MHPILRAVLIGLAPIAIVGAAILWDRLRAPHRNPTRPMAVADRRTYRDAQRRIERLIHRGDALHAYTLITAACQWLRSEIRTGPIRYRARYAADLEQLELTAEQQMRALFS